MGHKHISIIVICFLLFSSQICQKNDKKKIFHWRESYVLNKFHILRPSCILNYIQVSYSLQKFELSHETLIFSTKINAISLLPLSPYCANAVNRKFYPHKGFDENQTNSLYHPPKEMKYIKFSVKVTGWFSLCPLWFFSGHGCVHVYFYGGLCLCWLRKQTTVLTSVQGHRALKSCTNFVFTVIATG